MNLIKKFSSFYFEEFLGLDILHSKYPQLSRLITIVGREHYFECTRELPIGRIEEAIAAAKLMEDVAPFDGVKLFLAERIDAQSCLVYFFVIRQPIYELLVEKAWFIIPESMILKVWLDKHKSFEDAAFKIALDERELSVSKSAKEFRTSIIRHAQNQFSNLMPYSNKGQVKVVDELSYQNMLMAGLFCFPLIAYKQMFNWHRCKNLIKSVPWRISGLVFAIFLVTYLSLSTLYLHIEGSYLEDQLSSQRTELNQVFDLQSTLEKKLSILQALSSNDKLQHITANIWPIILDMMNHDIEVQSLRYESGDFIARAKAEKSTQIMEFLAKAKGLRAVELVSPVAKSRGEEIVTVKFSLLEEIRQIENGADNVVAEQ